MTESSACPLSGYTLRAAEERDIPSILDLERANMKAQVERYYPGSWDEQEILSIVEENLDKARVAEYDGAMAGFYYWWIEEPSTAFLHSIQVAPEHRSKGLGTWLMSCFESDARGCGLQHAGLTAFKEDPAVRLYERFGYQITGTDGPHAVEMAKALGA